MQTHVENCSFIQYIIYIKKCLNCKKRYTALDGIKITETNNTLKPTNERLKYKQPTEPSEEHKMNVSQIVNRSK